MRAATVPPATVEGVSCRPWTVTPRRRSLPARGLFLRLRLARGRSLLGSGLLTLRRHRYPPFKVGLPRPGSVGLSGLWPATTSSLPPTLPAQLLAFLVGDVENDAPFTGVVEPNRHLPP